MCAHANEHVEIVRRHTQTCGGGWMSVLSPRSPEQRRTDGWRRDRASFIERNKQAGLGIIIPPKSQPPHFLGLNIGWMKNTNENQTLH